jgi:hypothetical protein
LCANDGVLIRKMAVDVAFISLQIARLVHHEA